MSESQTPLTRAGLHKREQILATALHEARRRRHRRLTVRCALACAALVAIAGMSMRWPVEHRKLVDRLPIAPPTVVAPAPAPASVPPPEPVLRYRPRALVITRVATDPDIVMRLAVPSAAGSVARISDDQLLEQLAVAHQPAGLARFNGKTVLIYRNTSHSSHSGE